MRVPKKAKLQRDSCIKKTLLLQEKSIEHGSEKQKYNCAQGCPRVTHEYWKIALLRYLKVVVKLWIIYRQVRIFNVHLMQFSDKKSSH